MDLAKLIKGCVVILFTFVIANVNAQWVWQNPLPGTNYLNDVFFIDKNTGWAVGDVGAIIKTIDGGKSWESQICPSNLALYGVSFQDENHGIIVGGYI